jgi:hypothetical protein
MELFELLRREGESALTSFSVRRVVDVVDRVAGRFLDPADELRVRALDTMGGFAGFSAPMSEVVLDGMARSWMREGLWDLLRSEFPDPEVLDGFRPGPAGDETRALGFPLAFHLGAGTVPGVATTSMIRSLLVKSAVILKPGLGDIPLPVLFAHGLEEEDPGLARCVAVLYWPVDESDRTETVLRETDVAVVYGNDETVEWVQRRIPPQTPLRAYRHRMGFGLVGREALEGPSAAVASARSAALSVALFDQRGCVSPHAFLVETGGGVSPEEWTVLLGDALREVEATLPSGDLSLEDGVAVQQVRGDAELAEGLGEGTVHHGGEGAPWTVLYVPGGVMEPSCLNRTVRVLPLKGLGEALQILEGWSPYLQTVGVSGLGDRLPELADGLARLGVSRITKLVGMPWPRPWWHHDGTGPLRDLVRWTDWEGGGSTRSGAVGE